VGNQLVHQARQLPDRPLGAIWASGRDPRQSGATFPGTRARVERIGGGPPRWIRGKDC
jgi:hypothetical protein